MNRAKTGGKFVYFVVLVIVASNTLARQYTPPIGFNTIAIPGRSSTLVGLPLAAYPSIISKTGNISGNTLEDSNRYFTYHLDPTTKYVLEIESGSNQGKIVDIISFTGSQIYLNEHLQDAVDLAYCVRPLKRLSEVVDPSKLKAVDDLNPTNADQVLVVSKDRSLNRYFISNHPIHNRSFVSAANGLTEDPFLPYTNALYILRRDIKELNLELTASVKTSETVISLAPGYNFLNCIYPIGSTLANSSLMSSLKQGTAETADIVWIQNKEETTPDFEHFFFSDGSQPGLSRGWRKIEENISNTDHGYISISDGFIIQNRSEEHIEALFTPPDFYSDLN